MVATLEPRTRTETPERWAKALERAVSANLAYLELIGGDGAWAIASTRDPESDYIATVGSCTCEAGRAGDPCCLHRALVRRLVGMLADPEPEPTPPCGRCQGEGAIRYWTGDLNGWVVVACGCRKAA